MRLWAWALTGTLTVSACAGDAMMPSKDLSVPIHLAATIPSPERNPLTSEGIALGRKLFHDPMLSSTDTVACSTCHVQEYAFSDGLVVSEAGVSGESLFRNTPALINLAWMDGYFWDGGGFDLESQAFASLKHADEMAQDLNGLMDELAAHVDYPVLFQQAFKDGLTLPNVVRALAQFQRTLISAESRYDRYVSGEDPTALTGHEMEGLQLFEGKCAGCHATVFFTDQSYRNNGLDTTYSDAHERVAWGRARITDDVSDLGKYKVPTVRNIALTAPYMHDGRYKSLEAVLAHYRTGVKDSETLDASLRGDDGTLGIAMTDEEALAIIAFLMTLTDERFVSSPSFAAP